MTLAQAFREQSEICARMGSPFMGRLLSILSEHWDESSTLGQAMGAFAGDIGPTGHSLPLRIAGGLHALVLKKADPNLVSAYPPHEASDGALTQAVLAALIRHEDFLLEWTRLPPQTNEVRRSAALIAMGHTAAACAKRPVFLSELGASGGLNLMWDHFALRVAGTTIGPADAAVTLSPDWSGPLPAAAEIQVTDRAGVDLNPLDPSNTDDLTRLIAYLWADQPDRIEKSRAAAKVAAARVTQGDAIDWLEHRLKVAPAGHLHLIQHTVAWQYFHPVAQHRGRALIEAAGARATAQTPLAWMQMEADNDTANAGGAALTLRMWPGGLNLDLGRADFHGRWVKWSGAV